MLFDSIFSVNTRLIFHYFIRNTPPIQPILPSQIFLAPHQHTILILNPYTHQLCFLSCLCHNLCHRTPEPAHNVMFLTCHNQIKLPGTLPDLLLIYRLHRREGINRREYALLAQHFICLRHLIKYGSCRQYRHPLPLMDLNRLPDLKAFDLFVDPLFPSAPQPQVAGPRVADNRLRALLCLHQIPGRHHRHPRQSPHNCQVLRRLVAHPKGAIDKPASYTHNFYICFVVGAVISDLLQAPQRGEIADAVDKHRLPLQRHPRRQGRHVLLCDPRIGELVRQLLPEGLQDPKTQVPCHQFNVFIFFCQAYQRPYKSIPHFILSHLPIPPGPSPGRNLPPSCPAAYTPWVFPPVPGSASTRRIFSG